MRVITCILLLCTVSPAAAQNDSRLDAILERLERMEQTNQQLMQEVRALRAELEKQNSAAPLPTVPPAGDAPIPERVAVEEQQTAELAQTKVEASQKMPVALTGMLLFNAFHNGPLGTSEYPVVTSTGPNHRVGGASLRQTVLGLKFHGPDLPGNGKVSGSLYMDFFAGSAHPDEHLLHIRVATLDFAWKNTTITVGQDKPIIAPREPDSLAQVGVSPLTGAGNLWDWQQQARIEQRFHLGDNAGMHVQAGVYQTSEQDINLPAAYSRTLEASRPGYESRVEFWRDWGTRRLEIAPGYHGSSTHVAGTTVDSRALSLDWLAALSPRVQVTGAFFHGQDLSILGGLRQGVRVLSYGNAVPVHSDGGWAQFAVFATRRATLHVYGGEQQDRASDIPSGGIRRNLAYAGNVIYRIAPNVLGSFEVSQTRTSYLNIGNRLNNHYDLALAYLF